MEKYVLKIAKNNYFDLEKEIYFSELTTSEDNIRNYTTTAKSWVKLTFNNLNPLPTDHLTYIRQAGKYGCSECCSNDNQNIYGAYNGSVYCINDGNTLYSYQYIVVGASNSGVKSITTIPFDTV